MLTYAFDLLKEVYAEEGHSAQDAARLILENNLYGADLCPRAAALAGFALVMKARELDSRLLNRTTPTPAPNIITLTDVKFDAGEISNFAKELGLGALFDDRPEDFCLGNLNTPRPSVRLSARYSPPPASPLSATNSPKRPECLKKTSSSPRLTARCYPCCVRPSSWPMVVTTPSSPIRHTWAARG